MTEQIINPPAGISFSQSYYAIGKDVAYVTEGGVGAFRQGQNRWDNGYNIEFIAGYAQKIAGWAQVLSSTTIDIPRCVLTWRDNNGLPRIAVGTETHLYYILTSTLNDITPLRTQVTSTLTNPVTTILGSQLVTIADTASHLAVGDWVNLVAATAVGGVQLSGWYNVEASTPGTSYVITFPTEATSGAGPGGGSVATMYPRVNVSNPFTTTNASPTVKVTQTNHGASAGNYVDFSGASAVGGLTISGEYQIINVIDANNYQITAASSATSGAGPGGGNVSFIYPIPVQQTATAVSIAYGAGAYGVGAYSATGAETTPTLANGWTMGAYGDQLLACPVGGTIYIFDPVIGGRAYPLTNAPSEINAMFITPERFVVALGIGADPMEMAWSDQNDYTQWTTTVTNTAETGRTLVGGSYLVGGIAIRPTVSLIFSDRCCFAMTYTAGQSTAGNQNIYSTLLAGDNCGLVDPTAVCVEGGIAYWMSDADFWAYNGSVSPLPSDDIRTYVFGPGNLNRAELNKCTATLNRAKKQVRFYYPSGSSVENNVGLIFQYDQNCWAPLNFGRTAATDANLLSYPVSTDVNGFVYYDESGTDANGVALPWFLQLGATDISNGDRNVDVFGFTPDFQILTGSPQLNILTQYYPNQAVNTDGPYVLTATTTRQDLRSDGKLFGFSLYDNEIGSTFRIGLPRVDIQPSGARR